MTFPCNLGHTEFQHIAWKPRHAKCHCEKLPPCSLYFTSCNYNILVSHGLLFALGITLMFICVKTTTIISVYKYNYTYNIYFIISLFMLHLFR